MSLTIREGDAGYPSRTVYNAKNSDLTVAFAVDFQTAGEKLTRRVSGERYLAIPLTLGIPVAAHLIVAECSSKNVMVLNIAGNGIYTLREYGWTQEEVNTKIFETLRRVHETHTIRLVRSGGQTGVDIAGIIAAYALGIDAIATLPRGFMQRDVLGLDGRHTEKEIRDSVVTQAELVGRLTAAG